MTWPRAVWAGVPPSEPPLPVLLGQFMGNLTPSGSSSNKTVRHHGAPPPGLRLGGESGFEIDLAADPVGAEESHSLCGVGEWEPGANLAARNCQP